MIKLNLSMFGGRGGSGGGGGGGGGHGGSRGRGSAGGHGSGGQSGTGFAKNTKRVNLFGDKVSSVNRSEKYIFLEISNNKEINPREAAGTVLFEMIKQGRLRYSKTRNVWESKKGKRYVIRRRGK